MVYRPDIDGLRAIAVCIVIFFHFGIPGFSGGFIGVDVFFVLSGYLIGSIILNQLHSDKFSFIRFYFRRIRRLFPVFIVVMLATTAVAYLRMLPNDFREFGQSLVASSVYVSNLLFYLEAGYFDTASPLKPLLHTWSLSVEEQFYIIFPILAWIIYRLNKNWLLPLFVLFTLASLAAAEWYLDKDNSAVFYLYPFRAWEMFIGVCLATQFIPAIGSRKINSLLSLVGLAMILLPNFIYTKATPFPGLTALIPCFGTCLLIYTGQQYPSLIHRLLIKPIPVFIGKISYSLYLWHWPVFVLYMYDKSSEPAINDIAIMMAVTFVASVLSWRYIETPFREGKVVLSKTPLSVFAATAVTSFAFIGAGYIFHITNGLPTRFPEQTAKFASAANDLFGDLSTCYEIDSSDLNNIEYCPIGDPLNSDSYTLIWGDSHGGAYKRGFEEASKEIGQPALLAWTGGCPPIFGIDKDESVSSRATDALCSKRNQAIQDLIKTDKRINAIILVGRWSYYLNGEGLGVDQENKISLWPATGTKGEVRNQASFFIERFNATVKQLSESGHKVFVVEQVPEFSHYQARVVALGLINGNINEQLTQLSTENYRDVQQRQAQIQAAMTAAESKGLITTLKTHHFFCKQQECSIMINGEPMYFDNNHVSSNGAANISPMFQPFISHFKQKVD